MNMDRATFGGGCFWCLEAIFERVKGVQEVVSGYAGGRQPNPTYEEVCTGTTGHAEVVQISYDPSAINYMDLLEIFFAIHDPTTLNRQGNDAGTQYRSVIFTNDESQTRDAVKMIKDMTNNHDLPDAIVTEVLDLEAFYPAEEYHKQYYIRNGGQPYCRAIIAPKVKKFMAQFGQKTI